MTGETTTQTPGTEGFKQTKIAKWVNRKKKKRKMQETESNAIIETPAEIDDWMSI